jgi:hypothetical protein
MGKQIVWTDQAKSDIRGIEQPIALQILKTLGRYVLTGEGATKQLKGITPPLIRLRAQDHRVFFRDPWRLPQDRTCPRPKGGVSLMGYEAKKTEHGPKRGNGAYWGYKWEAKKESNRIRREDGKSEIRDASPPKKQQPPRQPIAAKKERLCFQWLLYGNRKLL